MMKTKYILKGLLATLLLIVSATSCESYTTDVIDELLVDRAFSPIDVKALVRNQTNVELNWTVREDVDHYVVEFSADDSAFTTIFKTVNVSPAELPITVALEGETVYSIRIKAVSAKGLEDSKWVVGTVTTLSEQIFTAIVDGDILATQATLRWTSNSSVTQITLAPGNIIHVITPQEKTSGIATITGLSGETAYTATLLNGTKKRGVQTFTTGIDVGDATLIKPTDDLFQKITDAASGDVLVLEPGDYTAQSGAITLAKSITLRGLRSFDKPKLNVTFSLASGTSNVSLIDLDLSGAGITNSALLTITGASSVYGDFVVNGCKVHDFTRSLISANATASKLNSFTVENSIVSGVNTNIGADFIDFRNTHVINVTLKNSTFDKCSTSRDFIRMDAATGLSGTGLTSTVLIDACTIYSKTMLATNRILYVRFQSNVLTVRNTLFGDSAGIYSNQAGATTPTSIPTFSNNNYFNSPLLFAVNSVNRYDVSSTYTTLDPGFTNATTGDFTISNQTLKDRLVGDPRWIK